ncbi:MAG: signal recognition particle protein [Armatimonadetes bacterium]|nr:signal recognition particle protein [Armatimonadota bacterium]MCX7777327.1 signal recognition particle protein [Armatimonadota bacterium]
MLKGLTDKLQGIFWKLRGKARLTEEDVDRALREIRLSLLEADVNLRVAKDFLERVRERAIGEEVLKSFTPAQQVIKIVYEELVKLLGGQHEPLKFSHTPPTIIMLMGLQGTGKTTTAGKVGLWLKRRGHRVLLLACDVRRPAAVEQLVQVGRQAELDVFEMGIREKPERIAEHGIKHAKDKGYGVVIADTGGRLHTDEEMMQELRRVKEALNPNEALLVVDAMMGQDAVNAARQFDSEVGVTGFILSKVDSDARGGAVLSIRAVTGKPVKFIGTGERLTDLDVFHPDRMAERILGMGDIRTLLERAEEALSQEEARKLAQMEKRMREGKFNLQDMLEQLQRLKATGPFDQLLKLLPGFSGLRQLPFAIDERRLKQFEAIILSMTPEERLNPDIIDGSRKRRIARGSGTTVQEVNMLLKQFKMMREMLKRLSKAKLSDEDLLRMLGVGR